jgi:hypothetical protein
MQPVMEPLFDSRHVGDMLLDVAPTRRRCRGRPPAWRFLQVSEQRVAGASRPGEECRCFDDFWAEALGRGGVWSTVAAEKVTLSAGMTAASLVTADIGGTAGAPVLMPYPSLHFYDGRGANRSWLQEIPDPVTKAAWSSWAEVHPDTAKALGAEDGQLVTVESDHGKLDVPLLVNAHLAPGVVAIPIGQGHSEYGRYAAGRGVNPIALIDPAHEAISRGTRWLSVRVRVTPRALRRPVRGSRRGEQQFDSGVAQAVSLADLNAGRIRP